MTVVIAGYARTPFTKFTGQLATESSSKLGAHAITAALARAGVDARRGAAGLRRPGASWAAQVRTRRVRRPSGPASRSRFPR